MPLTYSQYLKIPELLSLQKPVSPEPEHDETLFIIIHQVYELWFKQIMHEMKLITLSFEENKITIAQRAFKRILTILKTMVSQVDVLETMTPLSFSSFRDRLESASGFQSVQFREFETMLGLRHPDRLKMMPAEVSGKIEKLYNEPSLYDSFLGLLLKRGFDVPKTLLSRNKQMPIEENEALQNILVEVYRSQTDLADLCERLVDLDEGLQEWRYRHVKMVERTIGMKKGTGGSAGANYLKTTLFSPLFPDLWKIRTRF